MADGSLRARPEFWPVTLLSVALVAVLGGWSAVTYLERTRSDPGCAERITLRVAATPSIAGAARTVAERLAARETCLTVLVDARDSADVLRDLSRDTSPSAASPSASAPAVSPAPDVWLPESTLWLRRARAAGAFQVPAEGVSVATTPVVLALDSASATRLSRSGDLSWVKLVGGAKAPVPVALPDPATSPLGFATLVGIRALAAKTQPADAAAGAAAIMRRLAPNTLSVTGESPAVPPGRRAMISTELSVLGGAGQVALYPPAALPGPDYPYAVLGSGDEQTGATAFLRALLAAEGARTLTESGLRTPSGDAPAGIPAATRIRKVVYPPARLPDEAAATDLLNAWGGVHISARMLAVFDISGSMAAQVPGSTATRLSATVAAAQGGAQLLLGTTEIGIWEFSTNLDAGRDYREMVPVGPVGPRRAQIVAELGRMRVKSNGGTGLYDTTLAAYRDATRNWTPGRINMVLILTDGRDDDPRGIKRAVLLRELGELADRKRPVPILFIGVGPEIDKDELQQIAGATGGRVALTKEPSGIRQIFFTALAEFSCLPPKCRR
ncbi:substrate-binding domain-containing protein [Paractinoplanes hotanensis]|uniref:Substrate-binding and VWA domain-containing protein n=1 Tax=Paractinoplanes hotanensis TaxID=2906497 RepID=A0ABT0YAD6_9ACTN|nr:substrate-binding domain-containing protein [Actinoplanes hotanensis]MCM4082745.1 substrate-binding and VWA domain-containing protein [Actinoplanes hotanensis]